MTRRLSPAAAIVLAVAVLLPAAGLAATLGLYYDQQTWPTEADATGPVDVWLVLRDVAPGFPVMGWECRIETTGEGALPALQWELMGTGAFNFADPPAFAVGVSQPFPAGPDVVVARATMYPAGDHAVDLRVQPYTTPSVTDDDDHPVWRPVFARGVSGDVLEVADPAAGSSWHPEARLDPDAPALPPVIALAGDLDLGAVPSGAEEVRTITLRNPGPGHVHGRLEITGADYTLRLDGGPWTDDGRWLRLPPAQDVAVEIRLAPQASGPRHGRLDLRDGGSLARWALTGGGDQAPAVTLTPRELDFGPVPEGGESVRTVTVRNVAEAPVTITPGAIAPPFVLLDDPGAQILAPGEELTLAMAFRPQSVGLAGLAVSLGAASPPVLGHGYGAAAGCLAEWEHPAGGDFDLVVVGEAATRSVTFANHGAWDLSGEVAVSGDTAAFQILGGGGPVTIAPGGSHVVTVRCDPPTAGPWQAMLAGPGPCGELPLQVTAEDPLVACTVTPAAVDLGPVLVGEQAAANVTLVCTGNQPLTGSVSLSGLDDEPAFTLAQGGGDYSLQPGESRVIVVSFRPPAETQYTAVLDVGTGACGPVLLSGAGRGPRVDCAVDVLVLNLGTASVGRDIEGAVTVSSVGELPLTLTPQVGGEGFTLVGPDSAVVAPGGSVEVTVRGRLSTEGEMTGWLDLGHETCAPVELVCTGAIYGGGTCALVPSGVHFDQVTVGSEAFEQTALVNKTHEPLAFTPVVEELASDVFRLVTPAPVTVPPRSAVWLTFGFAPDHPDHFTGEILIEGHECSGTLSGHGSGGGCVVTPPSLVFPERVAGATLLGEVVVTNSTAAPLAIDPVTDHPAFTPLTGPQVIPAGDELVVVVEFTAPEPGTYAGELDLGTNTCARVDLHALALDPDEACLVAPDAWDIAVAYLGIPVTEVVRVTNRGVADLAIDPQVVPADQGFSVAGSTAPIPPGGARSLTVTFDPPALGDHVARLVLGPDVCTDVPLSAQVVEAPVGDCSVRPSSLDLGEIPAGLFVTWTVTIANLGEDELAVTLVDVPGQVRWLSGGGVILQPGESIEPRARFYAPAEGAFGYEVPVNGEGCAITVTGHGTPAAYPCAIEPYVVDLGTLVVGQDRFARFLIRNVGEQALDLFLPTSVGPFTVAGAGAHHLPALGVYLPGLRFEPTEPGEYFLPIDLGPDACGPALARGTAIAASDGVVARTPRLDLGHLDPGAAARLPLRVANTGAEPRTVAPALRGTGFVLEDPGPRELLAGEETVFWVRAHADLAGPAQARLTLGVPGHPDVAVAARVRDVASPAATVAVIWDDHAGRPADPAAPRTVAVGTASSGRLVAHGLAPGSEVISWRAALACVGGEVTAWQPAGEGLPLDAVDGAPRVILPAAPLAADADGAVTLARFAVTAAAPGPVLLTVSGGAGADWPAVELSDGLPAGEPLVTAAPDHAVARLVAEPATDLPAATRLLAVYPNPFNPRATIAYELARAGRARLAVYDLSGRHVATLVDAERAAGRHEAVWQGRDQAGRPVASGGYYVRLEADGIRQLRKMMLLR